MADRARLALDTEDDSNGMVTIINFYDGHTHTTFTRRDDEPVEPLRVKAWNWLYQHAPAHVWGCNVEYDLINLFGLWLGKMVTLQYVASGLLRATLRDRRVTFFDTLRHWPMTVEKMGRYIGLPKLEADFRSVRYCRRDTEIVWRFVDAMLSRYTRLNLTLKATLPSMALQLFQKRFYRQPFTPIPAVLLGRLRSAYYGGRVEVYRFGKVPGPIHHYDVNSLFPSVMARGTYPDLATYRMVSTPDWTQEGAAHVTIRVPPSSYPPLPVRSRSDMVYPYGTLAGWWCYPEIRQAVQDGSDIVSVKEAIEFDPRPSPFSDYIRFCYARRRQATHDLDDVLWKLYMNSLYGKFGQKPGLEMIFDDRSFTLDTKPAPAANVVWAAYVTCLARLRLLMYLRWCSACYYTDTDSLFTPDVLPTSGELGHLKQEGTYASMEAVGNKMYAVEHADGHFAYKAKGVRRESAEDFIRTGRAIFKKPARFRESRRTGAVPNKWYEVEKRREAVYTKRIVKPDGTTEPWEWAAYVAAHGEESE